MYEIYRIVWNSHFLVNTVSSTIASTQGKSNFSQKTENSHKISRQPYNYIHV